jgi:hypothetical protein
MRRRRIAMLEAGATWLEEPFLGGAWLHTPRWRRKRRIRIAGGEASHISAWRARIDYGKVAYADRLRPDRRIGPAKRASRLCFGPRSDLRQPHLHVILRSALAAALCGLKDHVIANPRRNRSPGT